MPLTIRILFVFLFLLSTHIAHSQDKSVFIEGEESLVPLAREILYGSDDFHKYAASEQFEKLLTELLSKESSFEYPFDSLVTISRLVSDDKRFRIFTWNLPKSNGTYEYFGIIQSFNSISGKYKLYPLTDKTGEIEHPAQALLNHDQWLGALYYKLIHHRHQGKDYYTLLGWVGKNTLTTSKLIEVLTFRSNGSPVFGYYLFKKYPKKSRRIIFEYSARSAMTLRYDKQKLNPSDDDQGGLSRIISDGTEEMIVFDRLVPLDPILEGQYQFYVPSTNIFDGFVLEDGRWIYFQDIDARNRRKGKTNTQPRPSDLDLAPPR